MPINIDPNRPTKSVGSTLISLFCLVIVLGVTQAELVAADFGRLNIGVTQAELVEADFSRLNLGVTQAELVEADFDRLTLRHSTVLRKSYIFEPALLSTALAQPTVDSPRFGLTATYPTGWVVSKNLGLLDLLNPADSWYSIEGPMLAGISIKMFDNTPNYSLSEVTERLVKQATPDEIIDVQTAPLTLANPQIESALLLHGVPSWTTDSFVLLKVKAHVYLFSLNIAFLPEIDKHRARYNQILLDLLNSMTFRPPEWAGYALDDTASIVAEPPIAYRFNYPVPNPHQTDWGLMQAFNNFFDNPRFNSYHTAEDWYQRGDNPTAGEAVYAVADGVVSYASFANYPGEVVIIKHRLPEGEIWYSMYGHLGSRTVNRNDVVTLGQTIGTIYDWPKNSHLHFEIRNFFIKENINGAKAAVERHENYPPGPGYWPVGRFSDSKERPPDQGWVEPYRFIESRQRHKTASDGAIFGQVKMQGHTLHGGTVITLTEQPCATITAPVTNTITSTVKTVSTDDYGYFELQPAASVTYQCLHTARLGFLSGEYQNPAAGDIGTLTLLNGDVTGDNRIDIFDMALISHNYKGASPTFDLNQDGEVDISDVAMLANNYGQSGPLDRWVTLTATERR